MSVLTGPSPMYAVCRGPGWLAVESVWDGVGLNYIGRLILEVLGGHPGGPREVGYGSLRYRPVPVHFAREFTP